MSGTFCFALMIALCGAVRAESWTNAAGRVIEARALELEGETLVLEDVRGHVLRLPLHSLAPGDQERAKSLFGPYEPPRALKLDYLRLRSQMERAEFLLRHDRIDAEEFRRVRQDMRVDFERCYQKYSALVSEAEYREAAIRLFDGETI